MAMAKRIPFVLIVKKSFPQREPSRDIWKVTKSVMIVRLSLTQFPKQMIIWKPTLPVEYANMISSLNLTLRGTWKTFMSKLSDLILCQRFIAYWFAWLPLLFCPPVMLYCLYYFVHQLCFIANNMSGTVSTLNIWHDSWVLGFEQPCVLCMPLSWPTLLLGIEIKEVLSYVGQWQYLTWFLGIGFWAAKAMCMLLPLTNSTLGYWGLGSRQHSEVF